MTALIFFRVKAQTFMGQTVKICGNIPELGNWNPEKAYALSTQENQYPTWLNESYLNLPNGCNLNSKLFIDQSIEFKCIIIEGKNIYWEEIPNRTLTPNFAKGLVFCTFNTTDFKVIHMVKKYSTDSFSDLKSNIANVRKLSLNPQAPYDQLDSSSDPESDRLSLMSLRQKKSISSRGSRASECFFQSPRHVDTRHDEIESFQQIQQVQNNLLRDNFPLVKEYNQQLELTKENKISNNSLI